MFFNAKYFAFALFFLSIQLVAAQSNTSSSLSSLSSSSSAASSAASHSSSASRSIASGVSSQMSRISSSASSAFSSLSSSMPTKSNAAARLHGPSDHTAQALVGAGLAMSLAAALGMWVA